MVRMGLFLFLLVSSGLFWSLSFFLSFIVVFLGLEIC